MTLPDPGTDPLPSEGGYGFLGRIIGLPILEQVILGRLEQLLATSAADTAALEAARATLTAADQTIDRIEPEPLTQKPTIKKGKP